MFNRVFSFIINKVVVSLIEKMADYLPMVLLLWKESLKKKEREKAQAAAEKEFKDVASNPEATDQEKLDAYKKSISNK